MARSTISIREESRRKPDSRLLLQNPPPGNYPLMTQLHDHKPKPDGDIKIVQGSARQRYWVLLSTDILPSKLYMTPPRHQTLHQGDNKITLCQSIWLTNQLLCTTGDTTQHPLTEGQLFAPRSTPRSCTATCVQDHTSEWATT